MAGLFELVSLISLDVVAGLVAQGARATWSPGATAGAAVTQLSILDVTCASPMVVTCAAGSFSRWRADAAADVGLHVVIAGVKGCTAANKQDPTDLRCEAWEAKVLDDARLELHDLDPATGARFASVGNAAYISGGTVSFALVPGRIRLGEEFIAEQSSAPRVVFVPRGFSFSPRQTTDARIDAREGRRLRADRAIWSERQRFDVHCWGAGSRPERHFTETQRIARQVVRSAQARASGVYEPSDGQWADQGLDHAQLLKSGRYCVFGLSFSMPITDNEKGFAPPDVSALTTTALEASDGITTEQGCAQG
jgi:hypothetical protein